MQEVTIRTGTREDIPAVFALVKELALYEKAPYEVENTPEQMLEDAFGEQPLFGFFVAELNGHIIATAIYYYRYSTWKGKRLYLEDIIVTEEYRKKGIGTLLFNAVVKQAADSNSNGISFQVLNWNEPAIAFYKKMFVSFDEEWINCSLSREQIDTWKYKS